MLSLITNFLKSLGFYIGAFFSGLLAEKYHDTKEDLKTQEKRDLIDAEPSPKKSEILERMKSGKLCLILLAGFSLSGCAHWQKSKCPSWPIAGPEVAAELEKLPENEYPALWDWLGRVDKFKRKSDI